MEKNIEDRAPYGTGLIIGKFMPLHQGHIHLIDFAGKQVEHLTVLVCSISGEPIPGEVRFRWVKELYPDVNVQHHTDENPQEPHEHPRFWEIWTKSIRRFCPTGPDVLFTSETYGDRLAGCLGAKHIPLDPGRTRVPVTGSQIRQDPYGNWAFIHPNVRPYYVKRVVVVGAESTGKTTLAQGLAKHYDTVWLPEYGREYIDKKKSGPEPEDFPEIARGHLEREDASMRQANRILIYDTDLIVTYILSDYYLGTCQDWIIDESHKRRGDLYLLTDTDIPWEADTDQREGPEIRELLHQRFRQELSTRKIPYVMVSGSVEERMKTATRAIDRLIFKS